MSNEYCPPTSQNEDLRKDATNNGLNKNDDIMKVLIGQLWKLQLEHMKSSYL